MKVTLFYLSGNESKAIDWIETQYPGADISRITRNSFTNMSAGQIKKELRSIKSDVFIIYCRDVEIQQKLYLLKAIALVTKTSQKLILDEKGKLLRCTIRGFLVTSTPKIILEFVLSSIIVIGTYLIVPWLYIGEKLAKNKPARLIKTSPTVPLKITFLRTNPWFGLKAGGSVSHIAGFSKAITGLGHKLFFISSDKLENIEEAKIPIYVIKPAKIFNTFVEIAGIAYNLKFIYQSLGILRRERPHFLYQRYDSFNWSGVALSKILGIPLIIEYNGSEVWKGSHWGKMRLRQLARLIEETVLFGGDRIVAISGVIKDELVKLGIREDKIILNPNGVDPVMFNPGIDGRQIRKKYGLEGRTVIGFLGTFGAWHGVSVLVNAIEPVVKEKGDIHFLLIGDGELRDSVEQLIEEKNLKKFVTITGIVSHGEVPEYLAACDILVAPHVPNPDGTPFFGSPTKLFEYMAMGKGIVASNLYQIGEALRNNHSSILVEPGNVEQLAEGILKLVTDKSLREKLGKQAREDAIVNYTWERNAQRVTAAIRQGTGDAGLS